MQTDKRQIKKLRSMILLLTGFLFLKRPAFSTSEGNGASKKISSWQTPGIQTVQVVNSPTALQATGERSVRPVTPSGLTLFYELTAYKMLSYFPLPLPHHGGGGLYLDLNLYFYYDFSTE